MRKRKGRLDRGKTFQGGKRGCLLLRGVVGKGDTLLDVALEALDSSLQESLLLVSDIAKDVDGLLGTVRLHTIVSRAFRNRVLGAALTPSSIGTEKKSTPVFSAIAFPPGMPGR